MKVFLGDTAYSLLMRGHGEVAGMVRRAGRVPASLASVPPSSFLGALPFLTSP